MEDLTKKLANYMRNLLWFFDYAIFIFLSLFKRHVEMPKRVKRILVVELLFIGDLIVTTPTIRALKKHFKQAEIYVMVRPHMKDVLSGNPNISGFLTYSPEEIKENFEEVVKNVRKMNFDLAVILHPGSWLIGKLLKDSKIPFRIGCTRVGFLSGKGFFLHRKTKPTFEWKHKLEDNLDVVRSIGVDLDVNDRYLEVYSTPDSDKSIKSFLDKNCIRDYVVIHAATQRETNRWFKRRFVEVADWIVETYRYPILFTGGKNEKEYISQIISLMKNKSHAFNVAGNSIKEYFSIIKWAKCVVSVDTSAMHIAAGFNKPVVALFGQGNPRIWRPYCRNSYVIFKEDEAHTSCMKYKCKFSGKRHMECMKAIAVSDVKEGVRHVLHK